MTALEFDGSAKSATTTSRDWRRHAILAVGGIIAVTFNLALALALIGFGFGYASVLNGG